jgi:signal transduction histidine kinase/ligand-binding sensor domain-containing protein
MPSVSESNRRVWKSAIWLSIALLCAPIFAIDRDRSLTQLSHTGWTSKDGAPGKILAMAQTTDGFLWLGTAQGLVRFDGVRFQTFVPRPGQMLPSATIRTLFAAPDGGLWIGFKSEGMSFLKDGNVTSYGEKDGLLPGMISAFALDRRGSMWAATSHGLTRLEGSQWKTIGKDWNVPGECFAVFVDRKGTLWISTASGIFFLPEGASKFEMAWAVNRSDGFSLAASPEGTIWIAQVQRSVRTVPLPWQSVGTWRPEIRVGSRAILFDGAGSLWIATAGDGIRRVPDVQRLKGKEVAEFGPEAESFTHKDGLTNDFVTCILEDREGNIWAGTNEGLDRFRQSTFVPVSLPSGTYSVMLTARDKGVVWASAVNRPLMKIEGEKVDGAGISGNRLIGCIYQDTQGFIWLCEHGQLSRLNHGHIDRKIKTPAEWPVAMAEGSTGQLWVSLGDGGVRRFDKNKWRSLESLNGPAGTSWSDFIDAKKSLWFGFVNNSVARIIGDELQIFSSNDGIGVGTVTAIRGQGPNTWIGGEGGLDYFDGKRFRPVITKQETGFSGVFAIVATEEEGLWFSENRGILHIPQAEIQRLKSDPAYHVSYDTFNFPDGLTSIPQRASMWRPSAIQGTDGRIWFALMQGVAWVDPKRILRNTVPPSVSIDSADAGGSRYSTAGNLKFPAHTTTLQISYTAPSLSVPERVLFRYRLDGQDKNWNEAGTRREAFYTNLGPGLYSFHALACNSDGIWNETGASWSFAIAPAFYQTTWFRVLLGFLAAGLMWIFYSIRLRRATAQIQGRLEERLDERERIARELHDTLLQGFQGLMLRLQAVMQQIPKQDPTHQMMEDVLDHADEVLLEGRERVQTLRTEALTVNELSEALALYGNEMAEHHAIAFSVIVAGLPQPLDPLVRDEAYRIGREALANAFQHSKASKIEVEVTYDRDMVRLRVRDNGAGMDEETLNSGRSGHWGLSGMRERAQKTGGQFNIWGRPGAGTEIELIVPSKVAYQHSRKMLGWSWRRLFGSNAGETR